MRTLSLPAKLAAYLAAALGLVVALGMPWYGASPKAEARDANALPELGPPAEEFFGALWRWASATDGTSGWDALQVADGVLLIVAIAAFATAVLAVTPATENFGRTVLRLLAIVALVTTAIAHLDQPGSDALVEARRGSLLAFVCGSVMLVTASSIAKARHRAQRPRTMTSLHDPSLAARSVGPPRRR